LLSHICTAAPPSARVICLGLTPKLISPSFRTSTPAPSSRLGDLRPALHRRADLPLFSHIYTGAAAPSSRLGDLRLCSAPPFAGFRVDAKGPKLIGVLLRTSAPPSLHRRQRDWPICWFLPSSSSTTPTSISRVCELDLIFNFHKAYYILDEIFIAGELQESSKKTVARLIAAQGLKIVISPRALVQPGP
ncbi:uncharacterized protein LOC141818844, partial [Curcuma longa]|uniref:uncharacterized protein LOC141818844 n=1 Tax=Curcuma longa TaxID=136217 RepID=UPI003D9EC8A4